MFASTDKVNQEMMIMQDIYTEFDSHDHVPNIRDQLMFNTTFNNLYIIIIIAASLHKG